MLHHPRNAFLALLSIVAIGCGSPGEHGLPNRDTHGNPDVEHYIARLESAERVADLQIDVVLEQLGLPPDAVVGDLGCGPGVFALAFARAVPRGLVYASDIEPRQLDRLRERIAEEHLDNVVPVLASQDTPHFPPTGLDLIFIGDTLHHLPDRVTYLRALQGSLKAGGRLAVFEYKPGDLPVGPPAGHKLAAGELERTLTAAGYVRAERFDSHAHHDFEIWRVQQVWER
jgi:ubiquinone/menaquinone biosynthesis C-methylase UbiE